MQAEPTKARTNRCVPVEQWPESIELLRYLAKQKKPMSIRDLAHDVNAPEISTRNRLARLEALGAVTASRAVSVLGPGKQVVCAHYAITQYGRDCAGLRAHNATSSPRPCVNSVFALAQAMNLQF
jgi:predicted ArsR family transcriptional regulator